ncbi:MAG: circadian clock protein KaiC [Anaerolineae bacterium]|nr:circadian clock protein KaiC [Anaerolineae bacterium]MDH7472607.1 circadian clock protein KaiC [Anaerolineae bacterium]
MKKVPTYIQGLDDILEGGLPAQRTTLIMGDPGSGKTVMSVEFLYRGALHGEPGIFLGFEESAASFRENALTMGWDLAALEADNRLFIMEGRLSPEVVISGKISLKPMLAVISGKAKEMGARRIALDALDVLLQLFDDPMQVRAELHLLNHWLAESGLTAVMTLKHRDGPSITTFQDFFHSIADCVINLDARVLNQVSTHRLRVIKYRGSSFGRNEYPYVITDTGIRTIPITAFELRHQPFGERISSGIPRLDALLDGGYYRASCVLLAGEPGTGKTLLATTFVRQVCSQGEKVLYLSLEESPEALVRNVTSAGIDLEPFCKAGALHFIGAMPEATGAEEHLLRLMSEVERIRPQHVVVDAISACERMGGKQAAFEYLMRLLNFLKERGITTIFTNQTSGSKVQMEISGNGISSMLDTVILISYVQGEGETNRIIQVLKSRGTGHSNQVREFIIGDDGLHIQDAYIGPGGVLTGTARRVQEARDAFEARRREAEIQAKRREIARLKAAMETGKARFRARLEAAEAELADLERERDIERAEREVRARMRGEKMSDEVGEMQK